MKNLLNLKGVKALKKQEQKTIQGGLYNCLPIEEYNCVVVWQGYVLALVCHYH